MAAYYTVYNERNDEIIASGSAQECAERLGIKVSSFYYAISRQRSGRTKKPRYYIEKEMKDELLTE